MTVRVAQAGDGAYNPAPIVDQSFAAAKASLTVRANDATRAYGAADPAFTAIMIGFVGGDTLSAVSGTAGLSTPANGTSPSGTYTITAQSGTLASTNYNFVFVNGTLTVNKAGQTISFSQPPNQTYGNAAFNLVATASSGLPVTLSLISGPALINGASVSLTAAGSVTIRASQVGDGNYNAAAEVVRSFDVGKAMLTTRANDATRAYGTANPTFSASHSGFVNGDTSALVSGAPGFTTAATATSDAGTYPITPSLNTLAAVNYSFAFANGTLTVTKADQTIAFNTPSSKTYGDVAFSLSAAASSGLPVNLAVDSGPATLAGNVLTITGAGSVTVRASQPGDRNYNLATPMVQSFTVAKANQTITFTPIGDKKMGDPALSLNATATSGLPLTFTLVSGPASIAGTVLSVTGAGNVTVRASQGGNSNYNVATDVIQTFAVLSVPVPSLQVNLSSQEIIFTWPASAAGFVLESTVTLSPPDWSSVISVPMVVDGQNVVINPVTGSARFYRLRRP